MRKITVDQGSLEWHDERFGCVTGTRLQSAVGAKWDARKKEWKLGDEKIQNTLMYELISERMSQNEVDDFQNKAMERGNELETFAIQAASKERGVKFSTCGMLTNDIDNFKFSPDAIYESDGVISGGLETKCPSGKKHVEYILNDEIPREYFWQVIGVMVMSKDVSWWDFCSYDDRNYERPIFMIRAEREEFAMIIESAREELIKFLDKVDEVHAGMVF